MNHPMVLRTGLPVLDSALCGGLHCGAINELVGTAGIGKTQLAKTLAVRCTLEYPEASVLYFDMERHFSAKRVHQIIQKRVQGRTHHADLIDDAMKRIRVIRVENLADFMKQFVSVPFHCNVGGLLVLERQPLFRAITVVKCPSAGPVIQPFTITASGVEAAEEDLLRPAHQNDDEDFDIYDDVLENLDLTGLPTVPPSNTVRSTQQSENDRDEDAPLAESDDIVSDSNDESSGNEDDGMLSKLLGI
ncbi:hypothetical protein Poli38472_004106 [Pythium oligandrum]|uniref:RecA family profile 1 domain-containing protein n=1 Tax=Pythium oligandrum TaxID=41045 RepID=A0A8K1CPG3_PYTOL|nr:hypothetical protein Poli38472_004106 [Pythium oligandrum]|eukprot:TMW66341.1 hypothetical protein Poli38472_004106 [Pythium oligandrum]